MLLELQQKVNYKPSDPTKPSSVTTRQKVKTYVLDNAELRESIQETNAVKNGE
jgi:hypothetical protein